MTRIIKALLRRMKYYVGAKRLRKKYHARIHSKDASMRAHYGYKTAVGKGSVIADNVYLGDYSYIGSGSTVENASIGKFCSISGGVRINPGEHKIKRITTYPIEHVLGVEEMNINERVIIGNDVLISADAIILKGVHIQDGAVIGAGAVVTHDVPPYAVLGGGTCQDIKVPFPAECGKETIGTQVVGLERGRYYQKEGFLSK